MKVYEESTLWKYLDWDNDIQRWIIRIDDIDDIPLIEAEPVRHGLWIIESEESIRCSECCFNRVHIKMPMDYCPNCGTKMDKE